MAKWIYKNVGSSIETIISKLSGLSEKEVSSMEYSEPVRFPTAGKIAKYLENLSGKDEKIFLVGDYDADGVTSSIILSLIFDELNIPYRVHIPRRMSEGYGISDKILLTATENVIMTVDNGIAAYSIFEALRKRDEKDVIIIDHHLASEATPLPRVKFIFDPEVNPEDNAFTHYCGAGLAYKVAEELFLDGFLKDSTLEKIIVLAMIGTVADVMPLVDENRDLVRLGLQLLPKWSSLLAKITLPPEIHSSDIGFKIGPCINATGRLFDDGGQKAYEILYRSLTSGRNGIGRLVATNEARKAKQDLLIEQMKSLYNEMDEMYPNFLVVPECPEGLVGILAGRLAEDTGKASFILTEMENGCLKGSARTDGNLNIKQFMDEHKNLFLKYGGHKGAGGFSMTKEAFREMVHICQQSNHKTKEKVYEYQMEVDASEIPALLEKQEKLEPFGEGFPKPVIRTLIDVKYIDYMKDGKMVKLTSNDVCVLGFSHGKWYSENKEPRLVEVLGTMSYNYFAGKKIPQMEALDMRIF